MRKIRSALHNLKKNIHVFKLCFVFQVVQQEMMMNNTVICWIKKQQNVDDIYLGEEWNELSCNLKQCKYSLRLWAKTTKWRALARYCLWYLKESFKDDAIVKWSIANTSCNAVLHLIYNYEANAHYLLDMYLVPNILLHVSACLILPDSCMESSWASSWASASLRPSWPSDQKS